MSKDMMLEAGKFCYYVPADSYNEALGGYVPSLVIENEHGHRPMTGQGECSTPWAWGPTYKDAQAACEAVNERMGITPARAVEIVASSMRRAVARY